MFCELKNIFDGISDVKNSFVCSLVALIKPEMASMFFWSDFRAFSVKEIENRPTGSQDTVFQ